MEVIGNSLSLLALLAGPAVIFALLTHFLEVSLQHQLASRFGWRSVLWTGWLGTPVHELSHVVACWLFGHRVDDVRLFDPDLKSGRLGYVRHSYHRGNWFQELGNVFIGTAPLVGGSTLMLLLLYLFYPSAALDLLRDPEVREARNWGDLVQELFRAFGQFATQLFAWQNWITPRLWIFLYLTLCVAAHMAPSRSDYEGASRGAILAVAGALVLATVGMFFARDPFAVALHLFQLAMPIIIMGMLSLLLCVVLWGVVTTILTLTDRRPGIARS